MLTTEELPVSKAIISMGYTQYVVDLKDAVAIAEALSKAEVYEEKYVKDADNTHHIYPNTKSLGSISLMSDDLYRMAKLAGKPGKD